MLDILKGLISGSWSLVFVWLFPSAVSVGLIVLVAYPAVSGLEFASGLRRLDQTTASLVIGFAVVSLGLVMSSGSTFLYRLLEGYNWPIPWLPGRLVERQAKRRDRLRSDAQAAPPGSIKQALLYEKARRYPQDATAPTRFGNAMRAIEAYGWDRWRLDSQHLWTHLLTVAPDQLRTEIDAARSGVSFWVSMYFNTAIFAAGCLVAALMRRQLGNADLPLPLLFTAVITLVLLPIFYHQAVQATTAVRSGVEALVDTGRLPLARALGLVMPAQVEDERRMWERVTSFVFYPYRESRGEQLSAFRPKEPPEAGS